MDTDVIVVAASIATFAVAVIAAYLARTTGILIDKVYDAILEMTVANIALGRCSHPEYSRVHAELLKQTVELRKLTRNGEVNHYFLGPDGKVMAELTRKGRRRLKKTIVELSKDSGEVPPK